MTLHQRIGQGIDFHRLEEGRELWLGGVRINSAKGCVAHSDGDVLIHAICDALLGAAGLNDIGYHFPDTSEEFRGIDSKILLKRVVELITGAGYRIVNIDSTVCLELPKLAPYITACVRPWPPLRTSHPMLSRSRPPPQRRWVSPAAERG